MEDSRSRNMRTGSILADDPSFFEDCGRMELMGHDEFIQFLKADVPEDIEDRLGSFPVTNITTPLYSVAKPFVWHRNESVGSVSGAVGDELRGETNGDQQGLVMQMPMKL